MADPYAANTGKRILKVFNSNGALADLIRDLRGHRLVSFKNFAAKGSIRHQGSCAQHEYGMLNDVSHMVAVNCKIIPYV